MEIAYKPSDSTVKPSVVMMAPNTVFIRRNIVESNRSNGNGIMTTYWTYEEARLTHEEFNSYVAEISAQNALNSVNDSDNIVHLLNKQSMADSNQMIVMEAIADLYSAVALNMRKG